MYLKYRYVTIQVHPSPPLADIVCFGLLRIAVSLVIFKRSLLARSFYTLIRNVLLSSPIDVGFHNPPPWKSSVLAGTPLGVWL